MPTEFACTVARTLRHRGLRVSARTADCWSTEYQMRAYAWTTLGESRDAMPGFLRPYDTQPRDPELPMTGQLPLPGRI